MRFTKKTMNNVFNNVFLKFGEVYEMQADKMYYSTRYLIFNSITKQVVGAGYTLEDTFLSLMSYLSYYYITEIKL